MNSYFFGIEKINELYKYIIYLCIVVLFLAVLFRFILSVDLDYYRMIVNGARIVKHDNHMNTMIPLFIESRGMLYSFINVILTLFCFVFPIPLLLKISYYYIFLFFIISFILLSLCRSINILIKVPSNQKPVLVVTSLISFILTQSIFEPDYGSVLRHLSPFFPLYIYVIFSSYRFKYINL